MVIAIATLSDNLPLSVGCVNEWIEWIEWMPIYPAREGAGETLRMTF